MVNIIARVHEKICVKDVYKVVIRIPDMFVISVVYTLC